MELRVKPKAEVHERTIRDLQAERASTLARVTEQLETALLALERATAACALHPSAEDTARRKEAILHAGERLWCVVVQREAAGLLRHQVLYEVLRVPREVKDAMGPRRRR